MDDMILCQTTGLYNYFLQI